MPVLPLCPDKMRQQFLCACVCMSVYVCVRASVCATKAILEHFLSSTSINCSACIWLTTMAKSCVVFYFKKFLLWPLERFALPLMKTQLNVNVPRKKRGITRHQWSPSCAVSCDPRAAIKSTRRDQANLPIMHHIRSNEFVLLNVTPAVSWGIELDILIKLALHRGLNNLYFRTEQDKRSLQYLNWQCVKQTKDAAKRLWKQHLKACDPTWPLNLKSQRSVSSHWGY